MVAVGPVLFVFFNIVDLSSTWEKMTEVDFFFRRNKICLKRVIMIILRKRFARRLLFLFESRTITFFRVRPFFSSDTGQKRRLKQFSLARYELVLQKCHKKCRLALFGGVVFQPPSCAVFQNVSMTLTWVIPLLPSRSLQTQFIVHYGLKGIQSEGSPSGRLHR